MRMFQKLLTQLFVVFMFTFPPASFVDCTDVTKRLATDRLLVVYSDCDEVRRPASGGGNIFAPPGTSDSEWREFVTHFETARHGRLGKQGSSSGARLKQTAHRDSIMASFNIQVTRLLVEAHQEQRFASRRAPHDRGTPDTSRPDCLRLRTTGHPATGRVGLTG
eukprot:Selendium_serpulae@DN624_c0_g1_i1.p1